MYEAANDPIFDTASQQYASLAGITKGQWSAPYPQIQNLPKSGTHGDGLPQTGIARTRGHCAGNGGLRGHSVGGVFPCVVFAQGVPGTASFQWCFKAPTGETHKGFHSYDDAYLAAGIWLDNRPVSFEPEVNV